MAQKEFLVGFTGFVGSNLAKNHQFSGLFNSKNIAEAFSQNPDLLVYAGIPARKFYANQNPEEDLKIIKNAIENIQKINPKKIVLISTIDVIPDTDNFYENDQIDESKLQPYGRNRYFLEEWVRNNIDDYLVVRLPALFGDNLKKNFIFDIIHPIPSVIESTQFAKLCLKDSNLSHYYQDNQDGFYKLVENMSKEDEKNLLDILKKLNFTALNFTDSRAEYQFYNLKNLWGHIDIALKNNLKLLHLATEPLSAEKIYEYIFQTKWENKLDGQPAKYNYKTLHSDLFNGKDDYIFSSDFILPDIASFVENSLEQKNEN